LKVKQKYVRRALFEYLMSPIKTAEKARELSDYMKTRQEETARDVQGRIDRILLDPNIIEKADEWVAEHAMVLNKVNEHVLSTIAWHAAFNQAVANGQSQEQAVSEANSVVRTTLGSNAAEDISTAEAVRPAFKVFMMFYSYFNNQANLMGSEFLKVHREMGLRKGAGRAFYIYAMGLMIPAAVSEMIFAAAAGKLDDDDDDEYLDDLIYKFVTGQVKVVGAMVPILGQTVTASINIYNNKPYDDRITTSPVISMIESTVRSPKSVYEALAEKNKTKKGVNDALAVLGLLGVPTGVVTRPARYMTDVADKRVKPDGPVDFARGLVTGKPGGK
jgi:hypothetical protein